MPRYQIFLNEFDEQLDRTIGLNELITCENCKYWSGSKYSNPHEIDFVCEYWASDGLMWNDFCSKAEEKETEEPHWDWRISYRTNPYMGILGEHIEYFCSQCGATVYKNHGMLPGICPECGAVMREEENNA